MKTCSVEGCENGHKSNGFCGKHAEKFRKYGDPLAGKFNKHRHGEGGITTHGYQVINTKGKRSYVHDLIVEKILGHSIPKGCVVHHMDGNGLNNVNANLVLCDSQAYHSLLKIRAMALNCCGHANWRKCRFCQQYDFPENMYFNPACISFSHRECRNNYEKDRECARRYLRI